MASEAEFLESWCHVTKVALIDAVNANDYGKETGPAAAVIEASVNHRKACQAWWDFHERRR